MKLSHSLLSIGLVLASCSKPEVPKITPRSARVTTVDAKGLGLTLELDVQNPNRFPLIVRTVDGTLEVGSGTELGRAHAEPKTTIPAKGTSAVTSQLSVSWTNATAVAPYALSNKPVPYEFKGTANLGGESLNFDVPFTVKGELTRDQVIQIGLRGLGSGGLQLPLP
jgi:LEA14-like dessication related protein